MAGLVHKRIRRNSGSQSSPPQSQSLRPLIWRRHDDVFMLVKVTSASARFSETNQSGRRSVSYLSAIFNVGGVCAERATFDRCSGACDNDHCCSQILTLAVLAAWRLMWRSITSLDRSPGSSRLIRAIRQVFGSSSSSVSVKLSSSSFHQRSAAHVGFQFDSVINSCVRVQLLSLIGRMCAFRIFLSVKE